MITANDLPIDVRNAVCNGGGPARGLGAWLVPDLLKQWTAAFNNHDAAYTAGGTWADRKRADERMRGELLTGVNDWASDSSVSYWRTCVRAVLAGVLVLLAVYPYFFAVRFGGGWRWLGSWKYRSAPASAAQVIEETRARLAYERKRGQGAGK